MKLFLGGNDIEQDNKFVWEPTKDIFTYSNWKKGSPDIDNRNENCVYMIADDFGQWDDINCNEKRGYTTICEIPAETVAGKLNCKP